MSVLNFDAVLFDCDGVLVDSEPITNGVLRDMLAESGWVLTPEPDMMGPRHLYRHGRAAAAPCRPIFPVSALNGAAC